MAKFEGAILEFASKYWGKSWWSSLNQDSRIGKKHNCFFVSLFNSVCECLNIIIFYCCNERHRYCHSDQNHPVIRPRHLWNQTLFPLLVVPSRFVSPYTFLSFLAFLLLFLTCSFCYRPFTPDHLKVLHLSAGVFSVLNSGSLLSSLNLTYWLQIDCLCMMFEVLSAVKMVFGVLAPCRVARGWSAFRGKVFAGE
jgi:hypothetical protein